LEVWFVRGITNVEGVDPLDAYACYSVASVWRRLYVMYCG